MIPVPVSLFTLVLVALVTLAILSIGAVMQSQAASERADDAENARREADIKIADLMASVENMRATAGPLPPVILHRTEWEQDEMNLEMQPSEAAAILARMDAQEQIQKVTEDRIQAIEWRRDERQITSHITSTAIEIRRHMAANRADFETQLIRRVVYCEEHVDQANRRLDLVELSQFAKNAKASKGKKKS